MNSVIYKVIFRGLDQFEYKNLSLTFRNLEFEEHLLLPVKFREFKNISEKINHVINFQNIEEVLIFGNPSVDYSYNYYSAILCTYKSDGKKIGFLICTVKNLGDIIIGIWPFNLNLKNLTREKVLELFNDIIENPDKFSNICLIYQ